MFFVQLVSTTDRNVMLLSLVQVLGCLIFSQLGTLSGRFSPPLPSAFVWYLLPALSAFSSSSSSLAGSSYLRSKLQPAWSQFSFLKPTILLTILLHKMYLFYLIRHPHFLTCTNRQSQPNNRD